MSVFLSFDVTGGNCVRAGSIEFAATCIVIGLPSSAGDHSCVTEDLLSQRWQNKHHANEKSMSVGRGGRGRRGQNPQTHTHTQHIHTASFASQMQSIMCHWWEAPAYLTKPGWICKLRPRLLSLKEG